jgi:SAM-dependent methyltransferase
MAVPKPTSFPQATDWNAYYTSVPATARLTRRYTTAILLGAIQRLSAAREGVPISIAEFGGANSCFLDAILAAVPCRSYEIVDTNEYGLSLLAGRAPGVLKLRRQDVLTFPMKEPVDLVFSVGLIEHFDPAGTARAVRAHFDALRPGGLAILTFPTPTWLYRATRKLLEAGGLWKFPDERPLAPGEVLATVRACGDVLREQIMWPLVLTQYLVAARKR